MGCLNPIQTRTHIRKDIGFLKAFYKCSNLITIYTSYDYCITLKNQQTKEYRSSYNQHIS